MLRPTCRLRRRRPAFLYFYCVAGADRHRVTDHTTSWMVLASLIAWATMSRKGEYEPCSFRGSDGAAVVIWTAALHSAPDEVFVPIFSAVRHTAQAFLAGTNGHQIFSPSGGTPPIA